MSFKSILVALDGSEYSDISAHYAFWLAKELGANLSAQHVIDPRIVDLFIAPEFAEELGFNESVETSEKVYRALRKIGQVILDLFSKEAFARDLKITEFLDIGYVVDEIINRSNVHDLVIVGHHGKGLKKLATELTIGSVAERVAIRSKKSVLVSINPVKKLNQILVAYDGSEPARGALLMAEQLAIATGKELKAMTVATPGEKKAEAVLTAEQGESYLRAIADRNIFLVREGHPAKTLIDYASVTGSLLVLGAYGFKEPDHTVMGSTTTYAIRHATTSLLIYR